MSRAITLTEEQHEKLLVLMEGYGMTSQQVVQWAFDRGMAVLRNLPQRACDECDGHFVGQRSHQRFCSDACRYRWHDQRKAA